MHALEFSDAYTYEKKYGSLHYLQEPFIIHQFKIFSSILQ